MFDIEFVKCVFELFDFFEICFGLRVNFFKIEVMWIGLCWYNMEKFFGLEWCNSVKVFGIVFIYNEVDLM